METIAKLENIKLPINDFEVMYPAPTTMITFTLGEHPNYKYDNNRPDVVPFVDADDDAYILADVCKRINNIMAINKDKYGYVNFNVKPQKFVYGTLNGCSPYGNIEFEISSIYNPCLGETPEDWFYSVMTYAYILSKEFKQDSTTISIFGWNNKPVSIVYVRHDNE